MIVLGINFGHDSSFCLIQDGKIIYALEEEKISRVKQDFGWPNKALDMLFRKTGITPEMVDVVAFGSKFYEALGANEIRYRFNKKGIDKAKEYIDRITAYLNITPVKIGPENTKIFEEEVRKLGYKKARVVFLNHHYCHGLTAKFCAPFDPDLVVTCDGHGDGEAFNFYKENQKGNLELILSNNYESSIGQFYSSITELLGFRPTRHEGKITGLAAFGNNGPLVKKFRELFFYEGEELRRFPYGDQEAKEKYWPEDLSLKNKINQSTSESQVGQEYSINSRILLGYLKEVTEGFSKEDIAYACQHVTETVLLEEVRRILNREFPSQKIGLGLAGGVFANVRVNQLIYEMDEVDEIFIQPAMGDSGLALGAAIGASLPRKDSDFKFGNTYLGFDFSEELKQFVQGFNEEGFSVLKLENPSYQIAKLLKENFIVGLWQGKMEWGPRALGNRSIILNTFNREVNDSLNERLSRTEFMPFAPSVLKSYAKEYFPAYKDSDVAPNYMTITYDTDPKYHDLLQAVVHVDGTARPQVVDEHSNHFFFKILTEFEKMSACGALVNTSFNAHEEPIVSNPETAYKALKDNRVDYLLLEDYLVFPNSRLSEVKQLIPN